MSFGANLELIASGMNALRVRARDFILPGTLGAASTLLRVAALSMFIPLVHLLFASEGGRLGRLQFLSDQLPLEGYPLPVLLGAVILLFAAASAVCAYISDYLETAVSSRAESKLDAAVFRQYLSFGQPYHDRVHLSKSAVQLRRIPHRTARLIPFLSKNIKALLGFLIYLVGMLVLSWKLALIVFMCLACYFFAFGRLSGRLEELEATLDSAVDEASVEVQDVLANAALVRHSQTQEYELQRWGLFTEAVVRSNVKKQQLMGLVEPAINFSGVFLLLAGVIGAAALIGQVQTADAVRYVLFFLFFRRAITAFSRFLKIPGEWKTIQRDLNRYFRLMDPTDKGNVKGGDQAFSGLETAIQVNGLNFHYAEGKPVLRDVHLTIPANRITMVVGPSGSGKSTFIKLLLREYEYQSGEILLNGIGIENYSVPGLLRATGFLGREAQLFSNTIGYNLNYGVTDLAQEHIDNVLKMAQCSELINRLELGLQTDMGDHGNLFSSGERQRIALARLLLRNDVSLYLLDEATSAVDGRTEIAIIDELESLLETRDVTIVLVTHRLSAVRKNMHVIFFDDGKVIEQGQCEQLLASNGSFRKLWDSQHLAAPD